MPPNYPSMIASAFGGLSFPFTAQARGKKRAVKFYSPSKRWCPPSKNKHRSVRLAIHHRQADGDPPAGLKNVVQQGELSAVEVLKKSMGAHWPQKGCQLTQFGRPFWACLFLGSTKQGNVKNFVNRTGNNC